jgi:predicted secreted protein
MNMETQMSGATYAALGTSAKEFWYQNKAKYLIIITQYGINKQKFNYTLV